VDATPGGALDDQEKPLLEGAGVTPTAANGTALPPASPAFADLHAALARLTGAAPRGSPTLPAMKAAEEPHDPYADVADLIEFDEDEAAALASEVSDG